MDSNSSEFNTHSSSSGLPLCVLAGGLVCFPFSKSRHSSSKRQFSFTAFPFSLAFHGETFIRSYVGFFPVTTWIPHANVPCSICLSLWGVKRKKKKKGKRRLDGKNKRKHRGPKAWLPYGGESVEESTRYGPKLGLSPLSYEDARAFWKEIQENRKEVPICYTFTLKCN